MPAWVRWLLVLPAALAVYLVAQFASGLVYLLRDADDLPLRLLASRLAQQLIGSVVGPFCCVAAGASVAPSRRFAVALALSLVNALLLGYTVLVLVTLPGFGLTATLNYPMPAGLRTQTDPAWWVILSAIIGIGATIAACYWIKRRERPVAAL